MELLKVDHQFSSFDGYEVIMFKIINNHNSLHHYRHHQHHNHLHPDHLVGKQVRAVGELIVATGWGRPTNQPAGAL